MPVFANSRAILHSGDGNTHVAAPPDVCKTPSPGGPVPIPYVNTASDSNLSKGAKKVKIEGNPVAKADSELSMSSGDEPGTAGGVVSNKFKGKLTWTAASTDVKIEGQGAVRFMDPTAQNANTFNTAFVSTGTTGQAYGDDLPCPLCGKTHPRLESTGVKAATLRLFRAIDNLMKEKKHPNPFRAEEQHYCDVEDVKKEVQEIGTIMGEIPGLLAAGGGLAKAVEADPNAYAPTTDRLRVIQERVSRKASKARMMKRAKLTDQFPENAQVSQFQLLEAAVGIMNKQQTSAKSTSDEAEQAVTEQQEYIASNCSSQKIEEKLTLPDIKSFDGKDAKIKAATARNLINSLRTEFKNTATSARTTLQLVKQYADQDFVLQVIRRTLDEMTLYLGPATEYDALPVLGRMLGTVLCKSKLDDQRQAVFAASGDVSADAIPEIKQSLIDVLQQEDPSLVGRHNFEAAAVNLKTRTERFHKPKIDEATLAKNNAQGAFFSAQNKGQPIAELSKAKKEAEDELKRREEDMGAEMVRLSKDKDPSDKKSKGAADEIWKCAAPKMSGKLTEMGHNVLYISEVFYSPFFDQKVSFRDVRTIDGITTAPEVGDKANYKELGHGETIPSCDQCQKWLPAYFCEKEQHCC
jgi:Domain of unknown function (DUF4150)